MGIDLLDLAFRLKRLYGVEITREDFTKLLTRHETADVRVGDLFDVFQPRAFAAGVLDAQVDGDHLWLMFCATLRDCLGVDDERITKEAWLFRDLLAD